MNKWRKYAVIARIHVQNAFNYRARVVSGLMFYTLFIFVFFSLWGAIYREGSVNGYTHGQVVWYLIITELVVFGCRIPIVGEINEDVKTGNMAYLLNRPVHYIAYQAAAAVGHVTVNLLFTGSLAIVLGLIFVGPVPNFHWAGLPLMLISMLMGIALQFFCLMAVGLTAFRLEDNSAIYLIYQKLVFMLGMFLPVEFLPGWLQGIARVLPFSYVAWGPARLFVDFSWRLFLQVAPMQILWIGVAVGISTIMYRGGMRNLQANGG
jgi:ABC-2 type transport system permease protein